MLWKKKNTRLNNKSIMTVRTVSSLDFIAWKLLGGFLILFFLLISAIPAQAEEFPADHWAAADLLELKVRGVLAEDTIDPDAFVTRAEFTKMLVTALDLKLDALLLQGMPSNFHDVPNNHPLKGYINAAWERGLIGGYTPTVFRPEEELQRVQMIALLLRVMGLDELKGDKKQLDFIDVDDIPDYAVPSVCEGVRLGLVKGDDDKSLRPTDKVTVAEAAAFINRWLELIGDRYDYLGKYNSVDLGEKLLFLEVDHNVISIPLAENLQIISQNKTIGWSQLEKNTPLAVKLNVFGQALIIQKKDVELSDVNISFDLRKLPKLHPDASDYVEVTKKDTLTPDETPNSNYNNVAANLFTSGNSFAGSNNELPVTSHKSPVTNMPATSNLFNARLPLDMDNITKSLDITKAEINLPSLQSAAGTDGRGIVVAVIDTGVDPSHPDLALTTDGKPKIVDWVDFTLEGLVKTTPAPLREDKTHVIFGGREYNIGDIPSKSGLFKMGEIALNDISPLDLIDFSETEKKLSVLLTDSRQGEVYDTIYIDTNGNGSFIDESALRIYRENQEYVLISHKGRNLALVVVDIDPKGTYVQLANDISGHGTHVAGIIAANGTLKGIAPGAQIMVLKAVDRDGFANPKNIVEAIRYAAIHGAHVINISLGQYQDVLPGRSDLAQIVNEVVEKYGVVVVTAAGNIGPGINSVAAPADADKAISVGAFVSPRMWEWDFGYQVPEDSLYYFSSVGPRRDGAWYPSVVAPGSAVSTVPRWMEYPYMLTEGTSMATPHVSGVVAHLLEAGNKLGIKTTPLFIKRVIEEGARDLAHFEVIEDGHGVLDGFGAFQKMKEIKEERKLTGNFSSPEYGFGPGVYAREYIPGRLMFNIKNNSSRDYYLEWSSTADWLRSELKSTYVLRGGEREIPLIFTLPDKPGLYSGVIKGDDPNVPGVDIEIPVNIVIGAEIHTKRPYMYTILDSLDASRFARYFITVPEGTSYLEAELEVFPNTSGSYEGRARLHLIDPFGFEEEMTDYVGLAPYSLTQKNKALAIAFVPKPGTWEVLVYSSASLSLFNVRETKYQLTVSLGDIVNIEPLMRPDLDLVVSPIPQGVLKKPKGTVILHIWDLKENAPYNGALEINGRFFHIQNGRVEYDIKNIKDTMGLRLTLLK